MTRPRRYLPNTTYLVSRRCTQRQFFLRPSKLVAQVVLYCLAYAVRESGVQIHDIVVMSNHLHIVLTDPHGKLSVFMHHFDRNIANCLNLHYKRHENFWKAEQFSSVELPSGADIYDKIIYALANPVAAACVKHTSQWPGLHTAETDYGEVLEVERPEIYFRKQGKMPERLKLRLVKPPCFTSLTNAEASEVKRQGLAEREKQLHAELRRAGKTFLGAKKCKTANPFSSPRTTCETGGLKPTFAAKDPELRKTMIARLKEFLSDYREALEKWRDGKRRVMFPAGTYAMRVFHGARCHDPG